MCTQLALLFIVYIFILLLVFQGQNLQRQQNGTSSISTSSKDLGAPLCMRSSGCMPYMVLPSSKIEAKLIQAHHVEGPIVRINPHELHIKDSSWAEVLYAGHANVGDLASLL